MMRRWKLVVGMTTGLLFFGCEPKPGPKPPVPPPTGGAPQDKDLEEANALVKDGGELLAAKDFDGAIAKAEAALKLKPALAEAKALLDKAGAAKAKMEAEAARTDTESVKQQVAGLVKEAKDLLAKGKLDSALAKVEKGLKLAADNAELASLKGNIEKAQEAREAVQKREKERDRLARKGATLQKEEKYEAAAKAFRQAAELAAKKDAYLRQANHCEAMALYNLGQRAEAARPPRLKEAQKYYNEACKKEPANRTFKKARDRAAETILVEEKKRREKVLADKLLAETKALREKGELIKARDACKKVLQLNYATEEILAASKAIAALNEDINYGELIAAADAALAADPPDHDLAAEKLLAARQIRKLSDEDQAKLLECRFHIAVRKGDEAAEAGNYTDAIDYYEEAINYKEDEAVAAKLEEVRNKKAVDDFAALVAKGDEATAAEDPRYEEAYDAYDLALKLADERQPAFAEMAKNVNAAKGKRNKAKIAWQKKLNVQLTSDWKKLLGDWKQALKKDPRAAKGLLEAGRETFKDSRYASSLEKFVKICDSKIDKAACTDWTKVKKQVNRGKNLEANIQKLTELIESGKVKDTKYEQMAQDLLAAQEEALKEAPPPEEPEAPAPPEGEGAPEAPPEPGEAPAPEAPAAE